MTPWAGCVKVLLGNHHLWDPRRGHFKRWFHINLGRYAHIPFLVHVFGISHGLSGLHRVVNVCVLTWGGWSLSLRSACISILCCCLTGSCLLFCVLHHDRYLYLLDTGAHGLPFGCVLQVGVKVFYGRHLPNGPGLYVNPEVAVIPQILQT